MITLKLLLWVAFIFGFAYYQYIVIVKRKSRPFYLLDFIFKGFAFIVYGAYIWDMQSDDTIRNLNIFLFCVSSFWLIFDMTMGIILHSDPLYIGETSGWIDKFGVRYKWAYFAIKIGALFTMIQTAINLYKHG